MWVLPTFNRAARCAEALASYVRHGCSTSGVVVVNGLEQRAAYAALELPRGWRMTYRAENVGMNRALNDVFDAFPGEPFYGFLEDDTVVCSDGWDRALIDAAGAWKVSHGQDGWQSSRRIHGAPCVGGKLASAVGALAIRTCFHWYGFDAMWERIDEACGVRTRVETVRLEHKHFLNPAVRAPKDATYVHAEARNRKDFAAYTAWVTSELPLVVARVNASRS